MKSFPRLLGRRVIRHATVPYQDIIFVPIRILYICKKVAHFDILSSAQVLLLSSHVWILISMFGINLITLSSLEKLTELFGRNILKY